MPEAPRPHIQCCFQNCAECATVRMHATTGWVNVCTTHYPKIERSHAVTDNPLLNKAREIYKNSTAYAQRHLPVISKDRYERLAAENPQREPGSDDA